MSACYYCNGPVDEDELGWCYSIEAEDESLVYYHEECIEVCEGIAPILYVFDWL